MSYLTLRQRYKVAAMQSLDARDLIENGGDWAASWCGEIADAMISEDEGSNSGEWIPWVGGECPVHPGAKVDVKLRCGKSSIDYGVHLLAGHLSWFHTGRSGEIIAYRIVEEP